MEIHGDPDELGRLAASALFPCARPKSKSLFVHFYRGLIAIAIFYLTKLKTGGQVLEVKRCSQRDDQMEMLRCHCLHCARWFDRDKRVSFYPLSVRFLQFVPIGN